MSYTMSINRFSCRVRSRRFDISIRPKIRYHTRIRYINHVQHEACRPILRAFRVAVECIRIEPENPECTCTDAHFDAASVIILFNRHVYKLTYDIVLNVWGLKIYFFSDIWLANWRKYVSIFFLYNENDNFNITPYVREKCYAAHWISTSAIRE